jgi:hypothetical protein
VPISLSYTIPFAFATPAPPEAHPGGRAPLSAFPDGAFFVRLKMREVTQSKAGGKASSLLGLSFLVGSLACDGVTGGAQVRADALPCGGD